jgi:predicted PurR-regulated permease PerM
LFAGFSARAVQTVLNVLEGVAASSGAVFNLLSMLMITPIVAFYFIRDWDHMVARVHTYIPRRFMPTVQAQFSAIDTTLAAYLRGQIEVMCVLAVYYAIALSIIGVPYALILALLSGVFIIIPYLGTLLSTGLAVGVAYLHFPELSPVWWTLGVYLAGQVLESQILTPKLIGQSVGLHPLWVIFGLLAGGALFGFVGVLLALPITAVIGVVVGFWMQRYQQSSYYHTAPPAPPPTDAA